MSGKRNIHPVSKTGSYFRCTFTWATILCCCFVSQGKTITYTADSSDFSNPERGFWGSTVNHEYIDIGSYKNGDLPQSFLDNLENKFKGYRTSGKKVIPRFKYCNSSNCDASLDRILRHIDQLGPVLTRNYDVIAVLEAGFVGLYGEWHSSSSVKTDSTRRIVLLKLLSVFPKERMVALRYNFHKRAIFKTNQPLTLSEAFNGSDRARTAAHNDCFCQNDNDIGTYSAVGSNGGWGLGNEAERNYLSADNLYVSQEGETCNMGSLSYGSCATALSELTRMRWDMLNNIFYRGILDQWKNQGCYSEISKRLGYRIRLIEATFDDAVTDGDLDGTLRLKNDGFGKIFNPRNFEMVFRNIKTDSEYIRPLSQDPRLWSPGQETTLSIKVPIPQSIPFGKYSLYLRLPDPAPLLYGKTSYSIRLANKGVWDATNGYNSLFDTVTISSFNPSVGIKRNSALPGQRSKIWVNERGSGKRSVEIGFAAATSSTVQIDVYKLSGAHVVNLVHGTRPAGSHSVVWQGVDNSGRVVHNGVYCVTFRCGSTLDAQKVVLKK